MTSVPDSPQLRSIHRQMRFATLRVVAALILREMSATYGSKPGGYVWAILEPLAGVLLMSFVFITLGLRNPALGTDFAIFFATGQMPFHATMNVSQKVAQSLKYSNRLLSYPRVTIVDALLARYVLNLLTQLLVSYIVIAGILIVQDPGTQLDLSRIVLGYAMGASLALGIGILNCFLMPMFPMWQSVWSIVTRSLVLLSGVMIIMEDIPLEWRNWLVWNPLVHVVAEVRAGFYHGYEPSYISPAYVFGVALVTGVVGFLFLWRFHREILEA